MLSTCFDQVYNLNFKEIKDVKLFIPYLIQFENTYSILYSEKDVNLYLNYEKDFQIKEEFENNFEISSNRVSMFFNEIKNILEGKEINLLKVEIYQKDFEYLFYICFIKSIFTLNELLFVYERINLNYLKSFILNSPFLLEEIIKFYSNHLNILEMIAKLSKISSYLVRKECIENKKFPQLCVSISNDLNDVKEFISSIYPHPFISYFKIPSDSRLKYVTEPLKQSLFNSFHIYLSTLNYTSKRIPCEKLYLNSIQLSNEFEWNNNFLKDILEFQDEYVYPCVLTMLESNLYQKYNYDLTNWIIKQILASKIDLDLIKILSLSFYKLNNEQINFILKKSKESSILLLFYLLNYNHHNPKTYPIETFALFDYNFNIKEYPFLLSLLMEQLQPIFILFPKKEFYYSKSEIFQIQSIDKLKEKELDLYLNSWIYHFQKDPLNIPLKTVHFLLKSNKLQNSDLYKNLLLLFDIPLKNSQMIEIFLHILEFYIILSRKYLTNQQYILTQETCVIQLLIEMSQYKEICSFIHQRFIENPLLLKMVHLQTYPIDFLKTTVNEIESMHICMDFIYELLNHNIVEKKVFGIVLCSYLIEKYPIQRFMEIAQYAIKKSKEIYSKDKIIPLIDSFNRFKKFPFLDWIVALHEIKQNFYSDEVINYRIEQVILK